LVTPSLSPKSPAKATFRHPERLKSGRWERPTLIGGGLWAESPFGILSCESTEGCDDLRFAVLEKSNEFGEAERLWCCEEERFDRALEVLRYGRRA
jgi:hypothetical protein